MKIKVFVRTSDSGDGEHSVSLHASKETATDGLKPDTDDHNMYWEDGWEIPYFVNEEILDITNCEIVE